MKLDSLNNTSVMEEVTNTLGDESSARRRNAHVDEVVSRIERNRRRISLSADKLINILEAT